MSLAVTTPILAAGAAVLKFSGDFETGMLNAKALTGASAEELKKMSDLAKELGATTQFSAGQAADAIGFLAQAGQDANQILESLPVALNLAAAGSISLAESADLLTNVGAGFNLEVTELANLADVMTQAFTSSNVNILELAESLKTGAPVATSFNQTVEDTVAIVGALGNAGIKGSLAGTALSRGFIALTRNSGDTKAVLEKFNITIRDSNGKMRSMIDILDDLKKAGGEGEDAIKLFGAFAGPKLAALVNQGLGPVRELSEELGKSTGRAAEIARIKMEGFQGSMKALKSAIEAVAVEIGESGLLKDVTGLANKIAVVLRGVAKTNPEILRMGTIFAGIAAAVGPVLIVLGTVVTFLGGPLALAIAGAAAGIALLGVAIVKIVENWENLTSATGDFAKMAGEAKEETLTLRERYDALSTSLSSSASPWEKAIANTELAKDKMDEGKQSAEELAGALGGLKTNTNEVSQAWAAAGADGGSMDKFFGKLTGWLDKLKTGGVVPQGILNEQAKETTKQLDLADAAFGALIATTEKGKDAFQKMQSALVGVAGALGGGGGGGGGGGKPTVTEGSKEAKTELEKLTEAVGKQNESLKESIRLIGLEGEARFEVEKALLMEKGIKEDLAEENRRLKQSQFDINEGLREFKKLLDDLPLIGFTKDLKEAFGILKKIEQIEFRDIGFGLKVPFVEFKDGAMKAVEEIEGSLTAVQDFASNIAANINSTFANTLTELVFDFDNFGDSFKSMLRGMANSFFQLLATIATNPIRIALEGSLSADGGGGGGGFKIGDITRSVGGVLKKIPGVDTLIQKATDFLGDFAKVIPVVGDIIAGVLAFAPLIAGLFKKTPRLDIDFSYLRDEAGKRLDEFAKIGDFLNDELAEQIVNISVKRKAGLGVGGDSKIKRIIIDKIQEIIATVQGVINKLPEEIADKLNDALLKTDLSLDRTVNGEKLFEFDAKGKKVAEKFNAFINGQLQAKFLFAIDNVLQATFEAVGVLPEKAAEFIEQKFEEYASAKGREAKGLVGQELLAALNAYVDAFNIVEGNLSSLTQQAVKEIKNLSKELGFGAIPSLGELRAELKTLIETADLDPSIVQKFVDLRNAIVGMVLDIGSAIQSTISQIQSVSSEFGLGTDVSGATQAALDELLSFYKENADSLSLEEKQALLGQIGGLNSSLAGQQIAQAQQQNQSLAEAQKSNIQRQIDQQRDLRDQIEKTFDARVEALEKEQDFMETLERINQGLKDDLNNLFFSGASPLTGVEKLNRINSDIARLEAELGGTGDPAQIESIVNEIRSLQGEALKIAGETFGIGSAEQIAIFQEIVDRTNALILLTDTQGRTSEQIQAEIERLNQERNTQLEEIDKTIEGLNSQLSSIGAAQIDATNAVSQEVKDNASFIVEELMAVLEEQIGALGEVTEEGAGSLESIQEVNEEMLVVQKTQLQVLEQIAASGGNGGSGTSAAPGGLGGVLGMAGGGLIAEPVTAQGLVTGRSYAFGEGGVPEAVLPLEKLMAMNKLVNQMGQGVTTGEFSRGPMIREGRGGESREVIEIVLRDEIGLSEDSMKKLEREVSEGSLGRVIVTKVRRSISARGGR